MSESFQVWQAFRELAEPPMHLEAATRYSIEVNYRTGMAEAEKHFVRLCLGYIMAAMKQHGYHVKHVYTAEPFRILISTRQWEDGEWVGVINFDTRHRRFVFHRAVYNKLRDTVTVPHDGSRSHFLDGQSAADITSAARHWMERLRNEEPFNGEYLNPVKGKRGPRR